MYGAGISDAQEVLNCGSIEYRAKGIYMDRYNGDNIFLPLMQSTRSKQERALETIELAGMIGDEAQKTFLTGCVIAISDNFIDRDYTRKIMEMLMMSKVLRALEEEAEDKGRMVGRMEGGLVAMKVAAKKLLIKGMSLVEIAEITGLSTEEIKKLGSLN